MRYVVIGGFAAVLLGAPVTTVDLDITPDTEGDNLRELASALKELGAKLRVSGLEEAVAFEFDEASLARFSTVTTRTLFGDFDMSFRPDAPGGAAFDYASLVENAVVVDLEGPVVVAGIDDIIASKVASNRSKDLQMLPLLYELRDQLKS